MDFDIKDAVYHAIRKTQKKDEPSGEVTPVAGLYRLRTHIPLR